MDGYMNKWVKNRLKNDTQVMSEWKLEDWRKEGKTMKSVEVLWKKKKTIR